MEAKSREEKMLCSWLQDKKGSQAKGYRQPLEVEKVKEIDSLLEAPDESNQYNQFRLLTSRTIR